SDRYAVVSQLIHHKLSPKEALLELSPREGEATLRTEEILRTIKSEGSKIAVILLGGINFYTGQALDMKEVTRAGRAKGCIVAFVLAHAAGNIPLELHDWNVDWAVWCSYKYLNSGPGAVAGCFIHGGHATNRSLPRLAGWWGH